MALKLFADAGSDGEVVRARLGLRRGAVALVDVPQRQTRQSTDCVECSLWLNSASARLTGLLRILSFQAFGAQVSQTGLPPATG